MRVTLLHALLLAFLCIRPLQVLPGTRVTLYEISPPVPRISSGACSFQQVC